MGSKMGLGGGYGSSSNKSKQGIGPDATMEAYNKWLPTTLEATSAANLEQLRGTGADVARESAALERELNPEYYDAIGTATGGARRLLDSINLNGLSPGEAAATERALNQYNTTTGNAGLTNPTNVVTNAMNFGGAFNNKVKLFGDSLQPATQAASVAGANRLDATGKALGNASPFNLGLLGSVTSAGNAVGQSKGSSMNANGEVNACCFIFLEALNGKLPYSVRRLRDKIYVRRPDIARGYKRMAKWLVPCMQHSPFVKWLVNAVMIKPAIRHCENNKECATISRFWLGVWAVTAD